MGGDCHWTCRDYSAEQRRQLKRQSVGRDFDPDRFDELGIWFRLRLAHRPACGHDGGAIEMLAAGVVLLCAAFLSGEARHAAGLSGFMAVGYLALFGSIIAINAYMYLIRNVSPALATSYAYVNPVVAVLLGTGLGGERLSPVEWAALV